ncbi:hypothetical protein [Xanthomonas medicagonis]|uniref:hypothetical protein n=1 Tax=Xanthomonas medicagonis TaxID=3160841 RepID=UPI00351423D1
MSIRFTRLRSNVCWAKPNHAFFYCQQVSAIFFQARRLATPPSAARGSHSRAAGAAAEPVAKVRRKQKQRKFPCFFATFQSDPPPRARARGMLATAARARTSLSAS